MADAARAQGLEVVLADAVAQLDSLEPASLSVVSAFHLVEHLPFEQILILVDAAFRALMPGGLLILETPNPENLVVGACTFWYDPTHIRPLPPAMLRFYVESAGFAPVRTARFYLRTDGPDHATIDEPVSPSIDGPLDYGLLAQKPR
jgi:O-antigen chain-terminating methyltransferase